MNRKGISPIIAVLLLVIIAVAAAILTYLWVLGYIGTVQQQGGTEALQERIKIEGVSYDGSALTVYIRNIGDVQTTIDAIYVFDSTGTLAADPVTGLNMTLTPGDVNSGQISVTLQNGMTYVVKVVSTTGAEATYTFTYRE